MYPTDHNCIYFRIFRFLKIYVYQNFYESVKNINKLFVYLLKDGWMFLQYLATLWCRRPRAEQIIGAAGEPPPPIIAFPDQLRAAAIDVTMWLLCSCRLRWSVFVVSCAVWCKQACLHDNIRLGNRTGFVFFCAFTLSFLCFCILFKISRLYSLT